MLELFFALFMLLATPVCANDDNDDDVERQAPPTENCCCRCVKTEKGALASFCSCLTVVCYAAAWVGAYSKLVGMADMSCLEPCACSLPQDLVTFSYVEKTTANGFFPMFVEGEAHNCTNAEFNATLCRDFLESDPLKLSGFWACGQDLDEVVDEMPELVNVE